MTKDRIPFPSSAGCRRWAVVASPRGEMAVRPVEYARELAHRTAGRDCAMGCPLCPGAWCLLFTFSLPRGHAGLSPSLVTEAILAARFYYEQVGG